MRGSRPKPPARRLKPAPCILEVRRMSRSSAGRSLLLYVVGLVVLCGAGWEVWSLWQQRGTQLHATSQALAASEARGPVVRITTVQQGPSERLITLLGD